MGALSRFADQMLRQEGAEAGPDAPVRPTVPPALALGLAFWAAGAAVWTIAQDVPREGCLALCALCAVAGAGCVAALLRGRRVLALCAAAGLLLGAASAWAGAGALQGRMAAAQAAGSVEVRMTTVEDASPSLYGSQALFDVEADGWLLGRVLVYLDEDASLPRYGEAFRARLALREPSGAARDRLWQQGAAAVGSADGLEPAGAAGPAAPLVAFRNAAVDALAGDGDASAVLQALVCGYTVSYEGTDAQQAFTASGLAHVVAVSGAHLTVVGSFVGAALAALRLPRGACALLQAGFMLTYLAVAGAPVSAVRAFAMMLPLQCAQFAGRRSMGLSALGACVAVLVAADPSVAVSASFALSALSTLGIALFHPLVGAWLARWMRCVPRLARDALSLTLASSLMAQPLSCALFSQLPLVAPLANVVAAPLAAPLCALGIVAACVAVAVPAAGGVLVGAATAGTAVLCAAVGACAALPFASVPAATDVMPALGLSAAATAALWRFWPVPCAGRAAASDVAARKRAGHAVLAATAALLAAVAAFAAAPLARGTELVMLDVGQGDALLVRSGGHAVLVDTGNQDGLLRRALARQGVWALDAVVVTHADDDHCGSLASLAGTVRVGRVIVARDALSCPCASCAGLREDAAELVGPGCVQGIAAGEGFSVGAFTATAVWPHAYADEGGNADSLCLLLQCDADGDGAAESDALLVGDAEAEQLAAMMDEGVGPVDVYKVGHHGSRNAIDAELAQRLSPEVSLVSAGEDNRYGHPAPETVEALRQVGSAVYRTDERGDVSCRFTPQAVEVSTLR